MELPRYARHELHISFAYRQIFRRYVVYVGHKLSMWVTNRIVRVSRARYVSHELYSSWTVSHKVRVHIISTSNFQGCWGFGIACHQDFRGYVVRWPHHLCICESRVTNYVGHEWGFGVASHQDFRGYVVRRAHHLCICESRLTNYAGHEVCMPRTIGLRSTVSPSSVYLWVTSHELCGSRSMYATNYWATQYGEPIICVFVSHESRNILVAKYVCHELLGYVVRRAHHLRIWVTDDICESKITNHVSHGLSLARTMEYRFEYRL